MLEINIYFISFVSNYSFNGQDNVLNEDLAQSLIFEEAENVGAVTLALALDYIKYLVFVGHGR